MQRSPDNLFVNLCQFAGYRCQTVAIEIFNEVIKRCDKPVRSFKKRCNSTWIVFVSIFIRNTTNTGKVKIRFRVKSVAFWRQSFLKPCECKTRLSDSMISNPVFFHQNSFLVNYLNCGSNFIYSSGVNYISSIASNSIAVGIGCPYEIAPNTSIWFCESVFLIVFTFFNSVDSNACYISS